MYLSIGFKNTILSERDRDQFIIFKISYLLLLYNILNIYIIIYNKKDKLLNWNPYKKDNLADRHFI